MVRIALGVVVALAVGWFVFGRGEDAAAVTDCLTDAGATVEESLRFAQLFPYAIAVRTLDRVEEYPELEGAKLLLGALRRKPRDPLHRQGRRSGDGLREHSGARHGH